MFQSTLPARGATTLGAGWSRSYTFQSTLPASWSDTIQADDLDGAYVSIHAPRAGSDTP